MRGCGRCERAPRGEQRAGGGSARHLPRPAGCRTAGAPLPATTSLCPLPCATLHSASLRPRCAGEGAGPPPLGRASARRWGAPVSSPQRQPHPRHCRGEACGRQGSRRSPLAHRSPAAAARHSPPAARRSPPFAARPPAARRALWRGRRAPDSAGAADRAGQGPARAGPSPPPPLDRQPACRRSSPPACLPACPGGGVAGGGGAPRHGAAGRRQPGCGHGASNRRPTATRCAEPACTAANLPCLLRYTPFPPCCRLVRCSDKAEGHPGARQGGHGQQLRRRRRRCKHAAAAAEAAAAPPGGGGSADAPLVVLLPSEALRAHAV